MVWVKSLCLTKHHAMKRYWRSGGTVPCILTSALDGDRWWASRHGHFNPRERATDNTNWIGGWVGPQADLDAVNESLCLTTHRAMKRYWGSGGTVPRILTSALDGDRWWASRHGHFNPRERATDNTDWIGGWVGPQADLDAVNESLCLTKHQAMKTYCGMDV
jgi:hypothetical protein